MSDFFIETGNIFIKMMYFDFSQGRVECIGHAHKYDHVTLLAHGSLVVEADGEKQTYQAPANIHIKAGVHHKLTALEDKTVAYCVHDTRGLDADDLGDPFVASLERGKTG